MSKLWKSEVKPGEIDRNLGLLGRMTFCISWSLKEYAGFMCRAGIFCCGALRSFIGCISKFSTRSDDWGFSHPAQLMWNTLELRVTYSSSIPVPRCWLYVTFLGLPQSPTHAGYSELHVLLYDRFVTLQFKSSYLDISSVAYSWEWRPFIRNLTIETFTATSASRVSFVRGEIWLRIGRSGARNRPV
jgi:hypothetical protein